MSIPSFTLDLFSLILIDNSPSLVPSVVSLPDNNCLSFNIFVSGNIKNSLVLNVDEVISSVLEDLPPLGTGAPDLHVSVFA